MAAPKFVSYSKTISGRRPYNQDAVLEINDKESQCYLWAVADGMGGAAGGEIASALAIETLNNLFQKSKADLRAKPVYMKPFLVKAVEQAHLKINNKVADQPELSGMGTTLVALLLINDFYCWCNIGDSRIYQFSEKTFKVLTTDHSYIEEARAKGEEINPAFIQQYGHVISRVIDGSNSAPDIFPEHKDFEKLDTSKTLGFLLCSDGLLLERTSDYNYFSNFYAKQNLEAITHTLIDHAYSHGSTDNISAVVARLESFHTENSNANNAYENEEVTLRILPNEVNNTSKIRLKKLYKLLLALVLLTLIAGAVWYFLPSLLENLNF